MVLPTHSPSPPGLTIIISTLSFFHPGEETNWYTQSRIFQNTLLSGLSLECDVNVGLCTPAPQGQFPDLAQFFKRKAPLPPVLKQQQQRYKQMKREMHLNKHHSDKKLELLCAFWESP